MKELPNSKRRQAGRKPKSLKKECDDLWFECIKARAGYISEVSGKIGRQIGGDYILCGHHLRGKSSYRLRYDLDNGVCCTVGEHSFGFHRADRREGLERKILSRRGWKSFDRLELLKNSTSDLKAVKIYLEAKLEEFKNE